MTAEIEEFYVLLSQYGQEMTDVAVRSSATAEDRCIICRPAGNFLNVRGPEMLMDCIRKCFASLLQTEQ
jgi:pyruvate,water dikinase